MFALGPIELLLLLVLGGLGSPFGLPPADADPAMERVAPEQCLFYVSWSGASEPNAESPNQTEQLLAEPEIQFFGDAIQQAMLKAASQAGLGGPPVEELWGLGRTLTTRPAAMFLSKFVPPQDGFGPPEIEGGLVVNTGDDAAKIEQSLTRLFTIAGLTTGGGETTISGVTLHGLALPPDAPPISWGFDGPYLIFSVGESPAGEIIAGLKSERGPPAWLTQLSGAVRVERPSTFAYVNVRGIKEIAMPFAGPRGPRMLESLGLANVTAIATASGLEGEGIVNRTLVGLDGPPTGLLSFASGTPLSAADLAPIPADATIAAAMRLDLAALIKNTNAFWDELNPGLRAELEVELKPESLGFDLDRLQQSLGDVWCVYSSPSEGGFLFTGLTVAVTVRDRDGVQQALDGIERHMQGLAEAASQSDEFNRTHSPSLAKSQFAGQTIYTLDPGEAMPIAPAWCLTENQLIVSAYPQSIKAYLARPAGSASLADAPGVGAALAAKPGPVSVSYQDTQALFRTIYPMIQAVAPIATGELRRQGIQLDASILPSAAAFDRHLRPEVAVVRLDSAGVVFESRRVLPFGGSSVTAAAPIGVAALLPAVAAARSAARRVVSTNNLKQIGLAMHNHHDVYNRFPAAVTLDSKKNKLLSWRVHVLPFVGEQVLYDQFHLDEAWDSEHNKGLIAKMPAVYKAEGDGPPIEQYKTIYVVARGKGSLFERDTAPRMQDITDGTSNTLMVLEASPDKAVTWTAPDDLAYDPESPLAGLGGLFPNGFNALMCDGSVHFIAQTVDLDTFRALITSRGGEPVQLNQ